MLLLLLAPITSLFAMVNQEGSTDISFEQNTESSTGTTTKQSNKAQSVPVLLKKIPHYFERNVGQHEKAFHYVAQTAFSQFAFAKDRVIIQLGANHSSEPDLNSHAQSMQVPPQPKQFALIVQGAQESVVINGGKKSNYTVNYLRGRKDQWRQGVETFSEIVYQEIYPGIDLKFYFNNFKLEYDFIVKAGVDPSIIRFKYDGIDDIKISSDDVLEMRVNGGVVKQNPPFIYQVDNTLENSQAQRQVIAGGYKKIGDSFAFHISDYNKKETLVIDPVIEFSAYFGGDWEDNASSVATDSQGNIFLAGSTSARARITVNNVMTLENTGLKTTEDPNTVNTYDGSHGLSLDDEFANGSSLDLINGIKTTENGSTEVYEYACDYLYEGFFNRDSMITDYDGFISKFDKDYNEIFTTYYGGCRNDGVRDLVIDSNDNVYIAGFTLSDNIPAVSSSQSKLGVSRFTQTAPRQSDAFYAKFNNDGFLEYSSYLGGDGRDGARGIAVDDAGALYITGYTHSKNLSTCSNSVTNVVACESIGGVELVTNTGGVQEESLYSDAFVAKISPDGSARSFITYFGGKFDDWGQSIALHDNAIYIAGNTSSPDLPVPSSGYSYLSYRSNPESCSRIPAENNYSGTPSDAHICEDVYLARLSIDGLELEFSTYLGGKQDDNVSDMAIDHEGNIYLTGTTRSQGILLEVDALPGSGSTDEEKIEIARLLNQRFPLYKHYLNLGINFDSTSIMTFLTVFKAEHQPEVTDPPTEPLYGVAERLMLSTYIGGGDSDAGIGLELGALTGNNQDLYLAGHTLSDDFFTVSAFQNKTSNSDLYAVKMVFDLDKKEETFEMGLESASKNAKVICLSGCDLYSIAYSTLLGGEALDALKDLHFSAFDNSIYLAGTTYSTMFPITKALIPTLPNADPEIPDEPQAFRYEIKKVNLTDYNPVTRSVEFQEDYYPSDMFLTKLSDIDSGIDLVFSATTSNTGIIYEGDKINYQLVINNNSAQIASSVRLNLSFPYLASRETIANYAVIAGAEKCAMDYNQIYCRIGDVPAMGEVVLEIALLPRVAGDFPVTFSLMSQTQISNEAMESNQSSTNTITSRVRIEPSSGSMNFLLIGILLSLGLFLRSRHYLERNEF